MDCPDKICVNTSWISKVTQSSACLPNKAYLTVS
ncbi:MAG: NusG domain II-containing protein [Oscillospiraceae bacterium]